MIPKDLSFDWDDGNREKCGKHGVSVAEIEALFRAGTVLVTPDLAHSGVEERFLAIGTPAGGRPVFVAFTFRTREDGTRLRPISARYMHAREIARYEEAHPSLRK